MNTIKYFDTISNNENVPNYTIIEILKTMCKDIDMQEISLIQVNKVTDTTYSLNIQLKNGKVITSNTFELAQGPQGDPGPQGPQGPEGPAGPQGVGFNFMSEPYVNNSMPPSITRPINFMSQPSFINPVSVGDPVALIYIFNSTSYLCTGTITQWRPNYASIKLSSVSPVGVNLLIGTCNVGSKPVAGSGTIVKSFNFNRTFERNESGIFFATYRTSADLGNYIIFGQVGFDSDTSTPFKSLLCKTVYDISSYTSLTSINIGDIDTVSYADDTATIQTNLILAQNGMQTTIPSTVKLPLKAGPNITINADETGKSLVISSTTNIASFDSLSDLYTFINQSSIVPLRLIVSLPAISGTLTQIDNNISTNTTTATQEDGYQYFVGREWNIVVTEYGSSALAGLSLDISANFSTSFHFAGTALNVYQYSIGYSENLIQSFIFQGILTSLSPSSIKLYYTETT